MCYCGCGVLPFLRAVFYCLRCVCLCWLGLCLNIINNTAPNYIPFVNVPMRCSALVDISDDTDAVLISVLMIVCVCVRVAYVDVLVFFFVLVVFVLSLLPLACLLFFLILDGWLFLACLMFCVLPLIVTRYVSAVFVLVVVVILLLYLLC